MISHKKQDYVIPAQTHIGHVHLKVSDLKRSLDFYTDLLGFEVTTMYGDQAAFISAGGYHHHIGLNTWHSEGAHPHPNLELVCIIQQLCTQHEKTLPLFLTDF